MNSKKMRKRKQRAPLLLPHASGVLTGVEKISTFHCNVNKKKIPATLHISVVFPFYIHQ